MYLKLKKWSEAEADCDNALKINPKHPKVFKIARQFSFNGFMINRELVYSSLLNHDVLYFCRH